MGAKKRKAKQTRRSRQKYPALMKGYNLKTRSNLIDYDYLDKLSDKELAFLNAFTSEYINADMNHNGPKLHKTKKQKKDCYDRNNARNRDILTRAQAMGVSDYLDDVFSNEAEYEQYLRDNSDEPTEE